MAELRFLLLECFLIYSVAVLVTCSEQGNPDSVQLSHGHENCGENEEVVDCAKPKWCNTCGIRGNCKLEECESGCDCKAEYYRNESGICIHESICTENVKFSFNKCGEDENHAECVPCGKTCETYEERLYCKPACRPGCTCNEELVKRNDGKCVAPEQCNMGPACGPNEEYSTCANPCNDCEIKGKCNFLVCNKGCDCKDGYYRDTKQVCIPEAECPKKNCGPNQEYKECGTGCPDTCDNYGKSRACTKQCVKGCFCKKGFVRNNYGECVIPENCGKTKEECNKDEVFQDCGTSCPDTCENYGIPRICTYLCVTGCFCKNGSIRNGDLKCITPEKCPKDECKEDEQFYLYKPDCYKTCENYNNPVLLCLIGGRGCFCKEGLVKRKDEKCVRPKDCQKVIT